MLNGKDHPATGDVHGKYPGGGIVLTDPAVREKSDARKSSDALLILSQITSTVSALSELDAILGVGVEKTLEFIGGSYGGIMLLDKGNQSLTYRVYKGYPMSLPGGCRSNWGKG